MELVNITKEKVKVSIYIYLYQLQQLEDKINYKFDNSGVLLNKIDKSKVPRVSNEEFEKISEYVKNYILLELLTKCDLIPMYVPFNNKNCYQIDNSLQQCLILATKDIEYNSKCLILVQGAGNVRLGEWARSVCINEGLKLGSMIPFVETAKKNGCSVLILNPNEKYGLDGKANTIFTDMKKHCKYVYKNIIHENEKIKEIYFISHSLGGECTVEILKSFEDDLLNGRIKKIGFTDSLHGGAFLDLSKKGIELFRKISRNYVASTEKRGKFLENLTHFSGCDVYSSGTNRHEYTTGVSFENVFEFLEMKTK